MPRAVSNDWYAGYVLSFTQLECMTIYMKKKTNEDHDNTQPRQLGTDTVKCVSVNGKLEDLSYQHVHCSCLGWS